MVDIHGIHRYRLFYSPEVSQLIWYRTFEDLAGKKTTARDGSSLQIIIYDDLYREKKVARASLAHDGRMVRLECFDDAGNVSLAQGCVTENRIHQEFERMKKHLPRKEESDR